MTIAAFRGTCPTCGHDHDADNAEFQRLLKAAPESPAKEQPVMVPRDDLIRWASWLEDADSSLGPYLLGAKRDASYKEAADEIRLRLAGTFSCPHCGIAAPHEHSVDRKGNVLAAKEQPGEQNAAPVDNTARNAALVADLRAIRQRAIDKGMKLLSIEEINQLLDREPPPPERP